MSSRNGVRRLGGVTLASVVLGVLLLILTMTPVFALPIPGSSFDTSDGNLAADTSLFDWANVTEDRKTDAPSGQNDDSFTQGSKEDTAVPSIEFGSIPPNKSDLKTFGVYQEKTAGRNFLHLYWTRVQDPSGTTNMDFEFNKSNVRSGNTVTPVRTVGDMLITYDLSRGGAVPTISIRIWGGSAWGPANNLSSIDAATGSINSSTIAAEDSADLGQLDPRTFGEASVDLDAVFDSDSCQSFGMAYLKSRSSDSFTAALKDFIAPLPVDVSNCGGITIRKETTPDGAAGSFAFTSGLGNFSLSDGESQTVTEVQPGSYTFTEADPSAAGFALASISCTGGGSPQYDTAARSVTVTVAADDAIVCTFTNDQLGKIIVAKQTTPDGSTETFEFDPSYSNANFFLADNGTNDSGFLAAGTYSVAELAETGWDLTSATCSDGSPVNAIDLSNGETVTCTFNNTQRGKIIIEKQTNPNGSAQSFEFDPSYGANFFLTDGGTNDSGLMVPGVYSVAEVNLPLGWATPTASCSDGSGVGAINLGAGETVTCVFNNTQLFVAVVLVCEQGPGALYPSTVNDKTSLTQAQLLGAGFTAAQIKTLCDLTSGARFPNLTPGGPYNYAVNIPNQVPQ